MSYEKVPQVLIVDVEAGETTRVSQSEDKSYRFIHIICVAFFTFLLTLLTTVCMIPQARDTVAKSEIPLAHTSLHNLVTRNTKRFSSLEDLKGLEKRSNVPKNILFPLYIDPGTNGAAWQPIYDAAAANPNVFFTLVINPNNGPNTSYTDANGKPAPDPDYIAGLNKLSQYSNTQVLGYVHQSYGARSYAAVINDVTIYSTWGKSNMYGTKLDGIFFDEGPSDTGAVQKLAAKINKKTKSITGFNDTPFIVQNPGILPPAVYFKAAQNCDVTIILEDYYSNYQKSGNSFNSLASKYKTSNSAFAFVFSGMPDSTTSTLKTQLSTMLSQVSYVFITDLTDQDTIYSMFGNNWNNFTSVLNSM